MDFKQFVESMKAWVKGEIRVVSFDSTLTQLRIAYELKRIADLLEQQQKPQTDPSDENPDVKSPFK